MSKVRAKCANCHKTFKASPKQTLCDDCTRKARAASKLAGVKPSVTVAPAAPPKITGPGAGILDPRLAVAPAPPPAHAAESVPTSTHDGDHHPHGAPHEHSAAHTHHGEHTRPSGHGKDGRAEAGGKPAREPRPRREPKPPTPPFEVTDELRARVEARYLQLAQPEFDGIRTQLAQEFSMPKPAVKRVVQELRQRSHLPSWWDLQAYTGTPEELERIRAAYTPLLPLPEVGIHKRLARDLGVEERLVYQGIRRIRVEMHLPQYNPPEAHATMNGQAATVSQASPSGPPTAAQ